MEVFALNGLVVCVGVSVLTLLALVFVAVILPRRAARAGAARGRAGAGAIALQFIATLLVAVLLMASTGLWINRAFAMYTSWSDLFLGSGEATVTTDGHVEAAPGEQKKLAGAQTAAVPTSLKNPLRDPALKGVTDTRAGQWVTMDVPGTASDVHTEALVYLPAGYLENPEQRYPVILAFSGIPGSPEAFRDAFHLHDLIEERVKEGTMRPTIIVSPRVYPGHYDTECVDQSDPTGHGRAGRGSAAVPAGRKPSVARGQGTQWETWISEDLAIAARQHLRTVEDPDAWATYGYSAGGWCATMISVRHPQVARTSLSLGGYFTPDYAKGQRWNPPGDPRYDLPKLLAKDRPAVRMYFYAGGDDPLPKPSLKALRASLGSDPAPLQFTAAIAERGGHAMTVWTAHGGDSLDWLTGQVPAFRPAKAG